MSYDRIPNELREYAQWVGWRLEDKGGIKPTKVPYRIKPGTAYDGYPADVTNPEHYTDFNTALYAVRQGHYSGIGFCLTKFDPFAFIDLDDVHEDAEALQRQIKIFEAFTSYAERSPSGTGLHIIIKGAIERGRKRASVEVYSADRFMTMTGDVYRDAPITEHHELLNLLWGQMGGKAIVLAHDGNAPERQTDEQLWLMACAAANGAKFYDLMCGKWEHFGYASQSEADFALIDIIAFYSQNREQIVRIFRRSGLAIRAKAQRNDYVNYMVNRSFDRLLPPIDIDGLRIEIEQKIIDAQAASMPPEPEYHHKTPVFTGVAIPGVMEASNSAFPTYDHVPLPNARGRAMSNAGRHTCTFPPGMVGDIAEFIYAAAPRPVREIALVGAIGFMAGMCGRAYNISGSGLNQYIMVIAETGSGKEAISSGIDKMLRMVQQRFPDAGKVVGPGAIASPEALAKYLNENPSFVTIIGEFGLKLKAMSAYNASPSQQGLKTAYLDLYNKSGAGKMFRPSIYSDKGKNISETVGPAFSICGESTATRFYEALSEQMIAEGLVPRLCIVEYRGERPDLNERHTEVWPSQELADAVATLASHCWKLNMEFNGAGRAIDVRMDDAGGASLRGFNNYCDARIRTAKGKDAIADLWNRAHLKALRLSALIAVGCNWADPVITEGIAAWSIKLIIEDVTNIIARFEDGSIGVGENSEWKQTQDFTQIIKEYLVLPFEDKAAKWGVSAHIHAQKVVPYGYISKRLSTISSFKNDRFGAAAAIKRVIMGAVDRGDMQEMPRHTVVAQFQLHSKVYAITNASAYL